MTSSFRRVFGALALLVATSGAAATAPARGEEREVFVDMDYARLVRMPDGAQTIVIGNPLVADVTMLKGSRIMVVTGRSFGTTNLILLDRAGAQVSESVVTVVPPSDKVVVQRGAHRESYSCRPDCRPAVDLGDDRAYINNTIEGVRLHESSATAKR
jgi:Flp pilus assembly secretin CpaC